MNKQLDELVNRLSEINDLQMSAAILNWDQNTYMPMGGSEARGRQVATLSRLAHEKFTDAALGKLLEQLHKELDRLDPDSDEARLITVTQREFEHATKIPAQFVADFANHRAASFAAWTKARPDNDFASVAPLLEKTLEYSRQMADFFPGYEHIADPLINNSDYGMKASVLKTLFAELRQELVPLVQAITSQPLADDSCLKQFYPAAQQLAVGNDIVKRFGYDFNRGRLDLTFHPFCTTFSINDVRITTRVDEYDLNNSLFSTLHESGHAMYEQGISQALEGTILATGTSSGVHESQSRLWENIVGRSRGFWNFYYPTLQQAFPEQLGKVDLDTFYRAINRVERSLIRTDADEVTYNLHVIIRFELELALLTGELAVRDLPEAWHTRYREALGMNAPSDSDGVLQDIHWYDGPIGGAFQGYTIGNILSAQFYDAALAAHPSIPQDIEQGQFGLLHSWLQNNIYRHGAKFTADEIIQRATGKPLTIEPYIKYLKTKFGELYNI